MYVCVKQAYRNSATNMKVSIFILYDINLICTKFGTFTVICAIVPKAELWSLTHLNLLSLSQTARKNLTYTVIL